MLSGAYIELGKLEQRFLAIVDSAVEAENELKKRLVKGGFFLEQPQLTVSVAETRGHQFGDGVLLVEERVLIQQLLTAWDAEALGEVKQPFPGGLMPD